MTWLSYIFPQTIRRTGSRYNRDIRVNLEKGRYNLLVNGARESGAYIEGLWRYALNNLELYNNPEPRKILVLGVAGGTVIHLLHGVYKKARIIGVDIDEEMIRIGRQYFKLAGIRQLRCVCADAQRYIQSAHDHYDLIVIDLFIGPDVPDFVSDFKFHRNIRKLLKPTGAVFINYLRQFGYEKKAVSLEKVLKMHYPSVVSVDRYNNRFFYCTLTVFGMVA